MKEDQKLRGLDATRFWAAMLIVLFHIVTMQNLPVPDYLSMIRNQFGRLAVPLFFTVSAFALFYGYYGKLDTKDRIFEYYLRRFFRIAPLFYLFMIIYIPFLYIEYGAYVSYSHIASSFLFVFNLMPRHASGYVWASWSIGTEMLFYFILPLLLMAVRDIRRAGLFFLLAVFLAFHWRSAFLDAPASIRDYSHFSLVAHIHFFAGGIAAYFAYRIVEQNFAAHARIIGFTALAVAFLSLAALVATDAYVLSQFGLATATVARALPLAAFVLGIALCPMTLVCNATTIALGKASFSIYLFHPLIIGIYMNRGLYTAIQSLFPDPGLAYAVCVVITLVTLLPISVLSYHYIERPGMRLQYRIRAYPLPGTATTPVAN